MPKRQSIIAGAKKSEREVQQYLWPGSMFFGGAKRPALEDEDLRGPGYDGRYWWGELKTRAAKVVISSGGAWAILLDAFHQCEEAIVRAPLGEDDGIPIPFSVLRVKGTNLESPQNLVMFDMDGLFVVVTLKLFKERFIGEVPIL